MNTPHPFWGSTIIGVESRSDAVEFRQAVAETGKKLGLRHRRRFHGAHKAVGSCDEMSASLRKGRRRKRCAQPAGKGEILIILVFMI